MLRVKFILALALMTLASCANWQTSYTPVSPDVSKNWALGSVSVDVPLSLSAGEANVYAPSADIVWQEEILPPGEIRHTQVDAIMTEAVTRGAAGLSGSRPVNIEVEVTRFHALSDYARVRLTNEGVHDITFLFKVTDARSGEVLVPEQLVRADLIAFSGQDSIDALAIGQTQRVRITDHVAATVAGLLGTGPDNRGEFQRLGR